MSSSRLPGFVDSLRNIEPGKLAEFRPGILGIKDDLWEEVVTLKAHAENNVPTDRKKYDAVLAAVRLLQDALSQPVTAISGYFSFLAQSDQKKPPLSPQLLWSVLEGLDESVPRLASTVNAIQVLMAESDESTLLDLVGATGNSKSRE